jgi:putative oxidoreductase
MNALLSSPALHNLALLAGRALLSAMFILGGISKITGYAGTAAYMAKMGVPGVLLPLVILTELGGGLAILLGWQTRLVALLLAGFTAIASLIFHMDWAQPGQQIMFMKNVAVIGGFLALFAAGAGRYAVDARG